MLEYFKSVEYAHHIVFPVVVSLDVTDRVNDYRFALLVSLVAFNVIAMLIIHVRVGKTVAVLVLVQVIVVVEDI